MTLGGSSRRGRCFAENSVWMGRPWTFPRRCCLPSSGETFWVFLQESDPCPLFREALPDFPSQLEAPSCAPITICSFSAFAFITWSGLCLSLLDEEVLDKRTTSWSSLYPPSLEQLFFFIHLFFKNILGTFCVLSPRLGADGSMASKAGVVPDAWNVIERKALVKW